jgi:hypothetical protein
MLIKTATGLALLSPVGLRQAYWRLGTWDAPPALARGPPLTQAGPFTSLRSTSRGVVPLVLNVFVVACFAGTLIVGVAGLAFDLNASAICSVPLRR